jgi:hypothetical protein
VAVDPARVGAGVFEAHPENTRSNMVTSVSESKSFGRIFSPGIQGWDFPLRKPDTMFPWFILQQFGSIYLP